MNINRDLKLTKSKITKRLKVLQVGKKFFIFKFSNNKNLLNLKNL